CAGDGELSRWKSDRQRGAVRPRRDESVRQRQLGLAPPSTTASSSESRSLLTNSRKARRRTRAQGNSGIEIPLWVRAVNAAYGGRKHRTPGFYCRNLYLTMRKQCRRWRPTCSSVIRPRTRLLPTPRAPFSKPEGFGAGLLLAISGRGRAGQPPSS